MGDSSRNTACTTCTPDTAVSRFDRQAFAKDVEWALISGIPANLDAVCQRALVSSLAIRESQLWVIIAATCLQLGRTKQIRYWLERLITDVAPEDVLSVIGLAVRARQARLALHFFERLSYDNLPSAHKCVEVVQETISLASLLRLPKGRNGVWATHQELLKAANRLLKAVQPLLLSEDLQDRACSSLAVTMKLLGES